MKTDTIALTRLTLDKQQIESLSALDMRRQIMITRILQELVLQLKQFEFVCNAEHGDEIRKKAFHCQISFVIYTLIGRIHESWLFLKNSGALEEAKSGTPELAELAESVARRFDNTNTYKIFRFIRNKFGFHYDTYKDLEPLVEEAMQEMDELEIWLSTAESGNDFFLSTSHAMESIVYSKMRKIGFCGTEKQLSETLYESTVSCASLVLEFSRSYLAEKLSGVWQQQDTVEIEVPCMSEVELPYLVASCTSSEPEEQ